jgi:LacI family transcriptional regulator, repressor for deo operon, udp, cdd, tsx, nupC, and nupG
MGDEGVSSTTLGAGALRSIREVTIEDVAREAGVSVATVSRALRNLPNVAPSTKLRVQQVADRLDYVAHPTAARLAAGKTSTVAVAVPVLDQWYFAKVVSGVEAVLSDQGFDLLLYSVATEADRRRFFQGRGAWWRRGDGLILVDVAFDAAASSRLASGGPTIVTIGSRHERFSSVTIDDEDSAREAVGHLISRGHERIALIWGEPHAGLDFVVPALRRRGYHRALEDAGIDLDPRLEALGGFSVDGGREAMAQLLRLPDPPTAVFAMSDEMAFGALDEIRRQGLRVPHDVAVVGFDDHDLSRLFDLTTVRQQADELGAAAARLLLDALRGESEPSHHVAPTFLVVRRTT